MTKSMPVSALNLLLFALLAVGLFMLMTEPAMAQGQINLSPITNILTGIADTLTGPLGRAMATLAVIGIGVLWDILLTPFVLPPVMKLFSSLEPRRVGL